jgi:predicted MFS family arabinose efflux permease
MAHDSKVQTLAGRLQQILFSPTGCLEGLLIEVQHKPIQISMTPGTVDAAVLDIAARPAAAAWSSGSAAVGVRPTKNIKSSLRGLDWLNFFLADVQSGVGPFLAIYLAARGWNVQTIGIVLTGGGIAGIIAQTPAGAIADRMRSKRALIAGGVLLLALGALLIAIFPSFWPVMSAQTLIGVSSSVFGPTLCAISMGLVGRELFDRRQGRNQTFNSAGNVVAAVSMGLIGYFFSNRGIFFFVVAFTVPTLWALSTIKADQIDYYVARGADGRDEHSSPTGVLQLAENRPLITFLICAVAFHFANAAMLPLLGEMLAKGHGRSSMMFMSACVVTTQLVVTLLASWSGRKAHQWGRKPLLLIAFAVLPIRGVLYTLTNAAGPLIAIQVLDGIGAAIFGVVSVLVIADLTRGSGRFNFTLGAVTTAVGIGAALSQSIAGGIVHAFGYRAGFLFLSGVALAALAILYLFMPETQERRDGAQR